MSSHPGVASVTLTDSSATLPADRGKGTLRVQHNKSGIVWRIHQLAIACTPLGNMTLMTTFNSLPLLSPVTVYSGTCADGEPTIDIGDHDVLEIAVTYGPPGANVILSYYFEEIGAS